MAYNRSMTPLFRTSLRAPVLIAGWLLLVASAALAQNPFPPLTSPQQAFGFNIGDDYSVVNYSQMETYWKKLDAESDRMVLQDIGPTAEGRRQLMAIVSSPANLAKLD